MRGKKLTTAQRNDKRILQAVNSIRKLEKFYNQKTIHLACNRYSALFKNKEHALERKAQLEKELAELKGRI